MDRFMMVAGRRLARWRLHSGLACFAIALTLAPEISASGGGKCAGREQDPDCALYMLARKCIDTETPGYCETCPRPRPSHCPNRKSCEETTEVWAGNTRFVAIRDDGMCACPKIQHGLVMPLGAVSGIEDVDRPAAIWKFAWDVASGTLDPNTAAMIASSPAHRTQNQLHVHLLPLEPRNLNALEQTASETAPDAYAIWAKADELAKKQSLATYGILVHKVGAGFHVHVEDAPLTEKYTLLPDCARMKPAKR